MEDKMSKSHPKNWRKVKLGDIVNINMGQSPRSEFYNFHGKGLPFFQGVTDFGDKYPRKSLYCSDPIKIAEMGQILFSVRAPVGDVNIATEKSCIGRGVAALQMKNRNNDFLYFLLKNYTKYFKGISGGTTYESINKDQIENIELMIPEKPDTQRRIAAILSAFDDKIELNNKINQTLEQIAQAIFKEWFVEFRFPGHEKVKFIDSELGRIPEGWEVRKAGEILELAYGKALKDINRHRGNVPVYGSNGRVGWHDEKLVSGPGIIIGRKGNPGLVTWSQTDFYPIDTTFYVVLKNNYLSLHYLYYVLERQNLPDLAADSAVPGLNRNLVYMNEIIIPSKALIDLFDKQITDIRERIQKNCIENANLAALRDLLLPKLMSGEVRV